MGQREAKSRKGHLKIENSEENDGNSFLTGQNKMKSENRDYFL